MRILIVEDDPSLRRALAMALSGPDRHVRTWDGADSEPEGYDTLIVALCCRKKTRRLQLVRTMKNRNRDLIVLGMGSDEEQKYFATGGGHLLSCCCRKPVRLATVERILHLEEEKRHRQQGLTNE